MSTPSNVPSSSSSNPVTPNRSPKSLFSRQLSQQLEREIRDDEHDFAEFGGDDPHEPRRHHRIDSRRSFEHEDRTVVNSVVDAGGVSLPDKVEQTEILVDWDGPDDPQNPQNQPFLKKVGLTAIVIILTVNVTFASSAPSTATVAIQREFGISTEVSLLVTSLFLVGYIFGPLLWSGLSEMFGRRPIFILSISCYMLFTIGQALAHNIETMLVTRFLSGFFASAPLTNTGGFIADIWDITGRGPAVAIFAAAVFIGPIMGPIVGSFVVSSHLGWRWVFWLIVIFAGACLAVCVLFCPETFAPVLLQKKAKRLRKQDPVAHGNKISDLERQDWTVRGVLKRTIARPFIMLVQEPILLLVTIYMSLVYGLIYAMFEVLPIIFIETRHFKPSIGGLTFIGIGLGTTIAAFMFYISSLSFNKIAPKWRGHPPAEGRLPTAMIGGPLLVFGIFSLTWTGAYESVPWYVPELATIPLGVAIGLIFISFQSYIVETYLMYSASALAANSVIRSAAGAAFPLFTEQMFHNLGTQWAGTLLGCVSLLLAPLPFFFYRYGAWVRTKSKFAPCVDLKIKEEIENEERLSGGETKDSSNLA